MKNNLNVSFKIFDDIKHIDDDGREFWYARELYPLLDYSSWQKFMKVLELAMINCKKSNMDIFDHFNHVVKMVEIGSNSKRKIDDYKLSRYGCYIILLNSDPRKEIISLGKTYFTIQTRKQEILEMDYEKLSEDEKRFYQRRLTKRFNKTRKNCI